MAKKSFEEKEKAKKQAREKKLVKEIKKQEKKDRKEQKKQAKKQAKLPAGAVQTNSQQISKSAPPSHSELIEKYTAVNKGADSIIKAPNKHSMWQVYQEAEKKKLEADMQYARLEAPTKQNQAERDRLNMLKQSASSLWEKAQDRKIFKNIEAREHLEKYRGNKMLDVVLHAHKLKDEDAVIDKGKEAGATEEEKQEANTIEKSQNDQKAEFKKSERLDSGMDVVDKGNTLIQHLGSGSGIVSDGISVVKDLGADAADLKGWNLKEAKESLVKEASGAGDVLGYVGSGLSFLNFLVSLASLGVELGKCAKRNGEGKTDKQERWLDARIIFGKLCDCVSNAIGTVSAVAGMIPCLGPLMNIADSVLQMLLGSVNLATNIYHRVQVHREKDRIWSEMERKKKKYEKAGNSDSLYFDMSNTGKNHIWNSNWDKANAKRQKLASLVGTSQIIDSGQTFNSEKEKNEALSEQAVKAETSVSTSIANLRKKRHEGTLSEVEKKEYKHRMHAMKALQLMTQYRNVEKAGKKMSKAILHDTEGLVTNGAKIVGNMIVFGGEVAALTGVGVPGAAVAITTGTIINMTESAYETIRLGASIVYKKILRRGANKKKERTRKQMAEYLFDKMLSVSPAYEQWENGFFKLDSGVPDYKVRELGGSMDDLNNVLRKGLDARVSLLLSAPTQKGMKRALASAFSQDGGASFASDGQ